MQIQVELTFVEQSLLLAAYFRGGLTTEEVWRSNSDQILTLSLFYTGDISTEECVNRFSKRESMNKGLYHKNCGLTAEIKSRYRLLIELIDRRPDLVEGRGNLRLPADPTFTSCRLTTAGIQQAKQLLSSYPPKPDFPWPDRRSDTAE